MDADVAIGPARVLTLQGGVRRGKNIDLGVIDPGWVGVRDGKIVYVGTQRIGAKRIIPADGKVLMPGFIDPHTHLVFAGSRVDEFEMKIKGKSYMEIREAGGGIMSTVRKTREADKEELKKLAKERLKRMLSYGVTTVEVKTGYGLTREDELKMLDVICELQKEFNVVPTFLGAHDFPSEYSREEWIQEVISMIPEVKDKAKFADVFCEEGVFTKEESRKILMEAKKHGLGIKIHADEIKSSGGTELAGELGAISCDHVVYPSEKGLKLIKKCGTIIVLLPGTSFFLGGDRPPVERMREEGIPLAVGTDFNPGSSPILSLPLVMGIGQVHYRLTPEEVIAGVTINAAYATGVQERKGSIEQGKDADLVLLKYRDEREIGYWIWENPCELVMKGGETVG